MILTPVTLLSKSECTMMLLQPHIQSMNIQIYFVDYMQNTKQTDSPDDSVSIKGRLFNLSMLISTIL